MKQERALCSKCAGIQREDVGDLKEESTRAANNAGTGRWHLALYSVTAKRAQKRNGAYDEVMLLYPDELRRPAECVTLQLFFGDDITWFTLFVVAVVSVEGLDGVYASCR